MELKYDIYMLNNAQGTGEKRQYVRIVQHEPMTEKQLQEKIQNRCSLTKGDVAAVLAELHDLMVEEFSLGRRFYIPEIGYFSMSASLEMPEENPDKKITGKEVRITGINFRPEGKLMEEVQRNVHFVRSRYSNQSTKYSEEKMLENIKEYLQKNNQISYIKPQTYEKQKTKEFKNDISKRENMQYLKDSDEYICQNGRKLKFSCLKEKTSTSGYTSNVYVYECENCSNCELKNKCKKSKDNKKFYVSKEFMEFRNTSHENITSELGIYLRLNRSIQVEGAFGVLKQNYKYRQFLLRGTGKVKIEFLILCMAYNINKLHSKRENKRLGVAFHEKRIS